MSDVLSYYGQEKSGKTTFGFTAIKAFPDGILVHFDFDLGRERAIWRFPESLANRIQSVRFPEVPKWAIGSGAITKQWADFEMVYEQALNDPQVKVLFIDTGTQMHTLNADEYLENYVKRNKQSRHQLQQIEFRVPNARTRAKIMSAREAKKLLIISHYERPIYVEQFVQRPDGSMVKESVETGAKTHKGFGDIVYAVDYHLQLFLKNVNLDPVTGAPVEPAKLITMAKILTPNPPPAFGIELPAPTYVKFMKIIDGVKKMSMMEEEE